MFDIGPEKLVLLLALALVILGPKKLPEIGRKIGQGLSEFRRASSDVRREMAEGMNVQAPATGSPGSNGDAAGADVGSPSGQADMSAPMAPHPPPPAPPSDPAPEH